MRLCQTSGAGRVSWKGLRLLRAGIVCGLVGEIMLPRPVSLGFGRWWGSEAGFFCGEEGRLDGDLLLGRLVGDAGASAGEAERARFWGEVEWVEVERGRFEGDF